MTSFGHTVGTPLEHKFGAWLQQTNDLTRRFVAAAFIPDLINMAGGLPDPSLFPVEALAEAAAKAITDHPDLTLGYIPTGGLPCLREAIAARYQQQGIPVDASNVLITASGTQALDLLGKVFLEPGSVLVSDILTYTGALDAWRPRHPQFHTLPMAELQSRGDPSPIAPCMADAAMVYMIPNFSNPTGHLVDLPSRQALVTASLDTNTILVEDDPYGTLFYDTAPLPSMLALAAKGQQAPYRGPVIHMGSLSKQLVPGLRVGWVVADPSVIEAMTIAKQATDLCSNGLAQLMTLTAIERGLIDEMQPRALALYRTRRDSLLDAMSRHISPWFHWECPVGGMFIWATAHDPHLDIKRLADTAMDLGVLVGPGYVFDPVDACNPAIRLNFTLNDEAKLDLAMRRLAAALEGLAQAA